MLQDYNLQMLHRMWLDESRMSANIVEILEYRRQINPESSASWVTSIPFEMELFDVHIKLCAVSRDEKITLKNLVHPAHQLCDIIVRSAMKHALFCGDSVKCSAGCMSCCKYAITVSPAEAFAIHEMIGNLPRQSRLALLRKMTIAGRKILSSYPTTIRMPSQEPDHESNQLVELSNWYSAMNLTCPWLENKLCSHYAGRPLVCKEFMVTSPPVCCSPTSLKRKRIVDLPIKMSEVLMTVCAELTGTNPQAMFLPLVPVWCENFPDLQNRYFNAQKALELLVKTVVIYHQNANQVTESVTR